MNTQTGSNIIAPVQHRLAETQQQITDIYTKIVKMGPLPQGRYNEHINASHGPDPNLMKFYCTQYSTKYQGNRLANFKPRPGKHTGTGYLSNFRPGVYYSSRIDELDNPSMGRIVADNYHTVTEKHFQPYNTPTGTEPLPNACYQVPSGFVRQKPITNPTMQEVRQTYIDTKSAYAPNDILPKHQAHLQKIQSKDPIAAENSSHGPGYMTTETHVRFNGEPSDRSGVQNKDVGPKEGSGFTNAYNIEPITFHAGSPHKGEIPGWATDRPTGHSIMHTHFLPTEFLHGAEPLPKIANRSDHNTGFTSGTVARPGFVHHNMADAYDKAKDVPQAKQDRTAKQDPAEFINMHNPNNYSSIAKATFGGQQRPGKSESDRLGRTGVGAQEVTGYVENNDRFVQTSDNPNRFITHYNTKYYDITPKGKDREGYVVGGIQPQLPDGFTKSTKVATYGPDVETTATLRRLHPYVARSVMARDKFYDDHTHDSKVHKSLPPVMS
ncbi:unnamed protein product [Owenia fusiformis]|uniref:Uncharacterized protein n=1 Tax=Owenia fusiformis TaxID=6347 RepID=A0A8J1TBL5_OWEFU|nr:unnamed protein product [Owenia fusiformis]